MIDLSKLAVGDLIASDRNAESKHFFICLDIFNDDRGMKRCMLFDAFDSSIINTDTWWKYKIVSKITSGSYVDR